MQFHKFVEILAVSLLVGLCTACTTSPRQAFGPQLDRARDQGLPMVIYAYGVPGEIAVDAGRTAVPVYVQFVVTARQALKQVQFLLVGYSKRGHPVRKSDSKIRAIWLKSAALFRPGKIYEVNSFHVRPAGFPGGMVACVQLVGIKLSYASGKRQSFDVEALQPLLLPSLRRACPDAGPVVYRKRR